MSFQPLSPDKPRDAQEQQSKKPTPEQLADLKNQIANNQIEKVVDTFFTIASNAKGEIPKEFAFALVDILSPQEKNQLISFLSNKPNNPKAVALKKSLDELRTEVSGQKPLEGIAQNMGQAAGKIVEFIDKGIERLGVGDQLNKLAAQYNIKIDANKNIGMLRDMLIGTAAKFVENLAMALKSFSPDATGGILNTSLELRLLSKAEAKRKAYRVAYTEWMKNPAGEPPSDAQAANYYAAWEKAPASSKPSYEQFVSAPTQPQTPAPETVQAKPTETKPAEAVAEKVEGSSKKIELEGGKWITFTKEKDKAIVETDKGKRQIKFNGQVPEVAVTKPSGTEKGRLEVKANGQTAKFDLLAMHKSLVDNPSVPEIIEGNIKINLEPV
jgi:hypothetical protein